MFNNKNIFVSGGTGSFGVFFIKYILKNYKPKKLIIYSRDELKQFNLSQQLKSKSLRFFLGDIRDINRLSLATKEVDYCIHAAAMKQVVASEYNPMEAIKTNIIGAENLIHCCLENKVKKVIALSTDKAASPINLYGATKLVSDKLFISANNISGKNNTIFSVVRYGNVAGSRGSVIPFYLDMLKNKEFTLPLTHPDMTRFMITLDEGVKFVSNSFEYMKGGEIFIPKIKSLKVLSLIKNLSKYAKTKDIGIRPGEKIHEVLCSKDESGQLIEFDKFYIIKPTIDRDGMNGILYSNSIKKYNKYKNEIGKKIKNNFVLSSENKELLMNSLEIKSLIKKINENK